MKLKKHANLLYIYLEDYGMAISIQYSNVWIQNVFISENILMEYVEHLL